MAQEQDYLGTLGRVYGFWQTGDQLILNSGRGVLTYRTSKPPASTDQAYLLVNQTWFLVSYNTTVSQPGDREPYTLFNPDGTLIGYTGCNELSGRYNTNLNQISISELATTRAACPDQMMNNQEQGMLALLTSAQTYQVIGTSLQLLSAQGALLLAQVLELRLTLFLGLDVTQNQEQSDDCCKIITLSHLQRPLAKALPKGG